ncbi:MAG: ABC transporter ATP-binding protein, partial [Bacteroidota bacterium]
MIKGNNIHKYYGTLQVLKGVDLVIERGEIISIVGKSGAGKSTLLHILGTLDQADSGTISIGKRRIDLMTKKELAHFRNQSVGFIFQFHHLLPEFTALENVMIPGLIGQKPEKKIKAKAIELLEYLGLADRLTHKPSELSGGEQQRVAVARALINEPEVVFADEPSGNLDTSSSQELHNLLFKLREDFTQTFVIVTHNEELAEMSDRSLEMIDGILK